MDGRAGPRGRSWCPRSKRCSTALPSSRSSKPRRSPPSISSRASASSSASSRSGSAAASTRRTRPRGSAYHGHHEHLAGSGTDRLARRLRRHRARKGGNRQAGRRALRRTGRPDAFAAIAASAEAAGARLVRTDRDAELPRSLNVIHPPSKAPTSAKTPRSRSRSGARSASRSGPSPRGFAGSTGVDGSRRFATPGGVSRSTPPTTPRGPRRWPQRSVPGGRALARRTRLRVDGGQGVPRACSACSRLSPRSASTSPPKGDAPPTRRPCRRSRRAPSPPIPTRRSRSDERRSEPMASSSWRVRLF